MSEWSYRLLSVLQSKARDRNQKPFETLERLEISLKSASVVQNVLYIIQGMSALRGLDVVAPCNSVTLANLQLHKLIAGHLYALTNLGITLKSTDPSGSDEASESFIDDLWLLFMSIFSGNVLQVISIDLTMSTPAQGSLKNQSWKRTAKMLASHTAFPRLMTATINITLLKPGGSYEAAKAVLAKLEDSIEQVFEPLRHRLGSELHVATSVIR
ncbi:hypothetical protein BJ165DRAFT_1473036 [Panaeolus papilionaceus]|nr:hypothetical protein BJ165DRAFT_1473036 [Panaeolus papilionaceus]